MMVVAELGGENVLSAALRPREKQMREGKSECAKKIRGSVE
jgi:hypothetical protein